MTAPPPTLSPGFWSTRKVVFALLFAFLIIVGGLLAADWWACLSEDARATYVGRNSCIQCHTQQVRAWTGSHHDLAMDRATPETVLGNFDDAQLTHFGITSKMFRRDDKYMVHTEGADGRMHDFEVRYVFGVEPLQQYMVEMDRPADMPSEEIARVQVLPICWDTNKRQWFHLQPPDVHEKIEPSDPLHWTGAMQRWNSMCADCHSTNVRKHFDVTTKTYHTTFSEIDVSCEACHGPGSLHVALAERFSLFWDRRLGYGLAKLKGKDSRAEIETCASCHSRRQIVAPGYRPGGNYYDYFTNALLQQHSYHPDGQILDEVYVHGSFLQSKMYHEGVRCTDCHDPHTARLRHQGNKVCISCHQHSAGKYDTPAHHHHQTGSKGALCVECHMPAKTYMAVDPRRDHSLRIPRPDLSVRLSVPNACTGCHLDPKKLPPDKRERLKEYAHWLEAARAGDEEICTELKRIDRWARDRAEKWYGRKRDPDSHWAGALAGGWKDDAAAEVDLIATAGNKKLPAMIRASALLALRQYATASSLAASRKALKNAHPQIRATAVGNLDVLLPPHLLSEDLARLLSDPVRLVRSEAGRALARVPAGNLTGPERQARQAAIDEYTRGLLANNDRAFAHLSMGLLHERLAGTDPSGWLKAETAYRTAISVEPDTAGPRSNLAGLLELQTEMARVAGRAADARRYRDEVKRLRDEELRLLARDARYAPDNAPVQHQYGLALVLSGQLAAAEQPLLAARRLAPNVSQYLYHLTVYYKDQQRWDRARQCAEKLLEKWPDDPRFTLVHQEIRQQARKEAATVPLP